MFEVKCDVKGCSTREMLPATFGTLPPGWRSVAYMEQLHRRAPADADILGDLSSMLPPEMAGSFKTLMSSSIPRPAPFSERHHHRHMCPNHDLPAFSDATSED